MLTLSSLVTRHLSLFNHSKKPIILLFRINIFEVVNIFYRK